MTFFVMSFAELFHAFNLRSDKFSLFKTGIWSNKTLVVTVVLCVFINVVVSALPVFQIALGINSLSLYQWLLVFVLSLAIIPVGEVYKMVANKRSK